MAVAAPAVDSEATVYSFRKNAREEVRATLSTFHGYRLASLRVYVQDETGAGRPTQKGLAIRVEDLPALREAIEALQAAA